MDKFDIRRERLRAVMDRQFDGKQSLLANALEMNNATYVSRMLSQPGSAGHKRISWDFAREIELKLRLPNEYLEGDLNRIAEPKSVPVMDFSQDAWEFAREWDRLEGPQKAQIQEYVRYLVKSQIDAKARPPKAASPKVSITPSKSVKPAKLPHGASGARKKPHDPQH